LRIPWLRDSFFVCEKMKERKFVLPCVTSMRKERRIFYICQEKIKVKVIHGKR